MDLRPGIVQGRRGRQQKVRKSTVPGSGSARGGGAAGSARRESRSPDQRERGESVISGSDARAAKGRERGIG
jgi:hypothetical protein